MTDNPSSIDHLDDLVQLHEEINIIYTPIEYHATLATMDGDRPVATGTGNTILEAMMDLVDKTKGLTIVDVRHWNRGEIE